MHPGWRRCSSLKYARYSRSSRLASRAPRRPRCDAGAFTTGCYPVQAQSVVETGNGASWIDSEPSTNHGYHGRNRDGTESNVRSDRVRRLAGGFDICVQLAEHPCGIPVPPPPTPAPQTPSPGAPPSEPPPSPAATAPGPATTSLDCALIAEPGEPIATVALVDRVDPSNAPRPSNESEHLLFRQLYETLIRVDCKGRVRPGLAESWRLDADGRTWIVTLREHARFSDGTPVTSTDVRAGWMRDGAGDELLPHVSRLVQSVVPLDDRTVAIALRSPRVDMPLALAHTDLAIARPAAASRWPLGTRTDGAAPEPDAPAAAVDSVITVRRDNLPSLRFVVAPGDPRDLLDRGLDLLLTRDPAALDYAATLPHFQSVPLEWQRIHVLAHTRTHARVARHCLRRRARSWPAMPFAVKHGARWARSGGRCCRPARSRLPSRESKPHSHRESSMTCATPLRAIWPSAWSGWPAVQALSETRFWRCCFRIVSAGPTSRPPH